MKNKLTAFAAFIIKLIMLIFCGYVTLASIFTTVRLTNSEFLYFTSDNALVNIAVISAVIIITTVLLKIFDRHGNKVNSSRALPFIFYVIYAMYIVLLLYMVLSGRLVPKFDAHRISRAAVQIMQGDYSNFLKGGYARTCDNQYGIILLLAGFYKIFGRNNYVAVELFNVVCYAAVVWLMRMLAERLLPKAEKWLADIAGIALCLFMPMWGYVTYIYGTAPYLVLSIGAMILEYDFFENLECLKNAELKNETADNAPEDKNKKGKLGIRKIFLAGVLIALATVVKANALIYLLAMLAYGVVKFTQIAKKNHIAGLKENGTEGNEYKEPGSKVNVAKETGSKENELQGTDSHEHSETYANGYESAYVNAYGNDVADTAEIAQLNGLTDHVKRILVSSLGLLWIIAAYVIASKGLAVTMKNITGMDNLAGAPRTAHLAMGLQESSNKSSGWFNGYAHEVFENNDYNSDSANAEAIDNIKESLGSFAADPAHAVGFFTKKTVSQWCEPTYESLFINMIRPTQAGKVAWWLDAVTENGFGSGILIGWMNILQSIIYFGCFAYCVLAFTRKDNGCFDELFPAIVIIGGMLFHMLWEANSQYTFVYAIWMVIYAVIGYIRLGGMLGVVWAGKKNRGNIEDIHEPEDSEKSDISDILKVQGKTGLNDTRRRFHAVCVSLIILLLAEAAVAVMPDESFIGRAFKMNWDDAEYAQILADNKNNPAGEWLNTVAEPTENYLEKTDAVFLGDVFRSKELNPENAVIKNGRYVIRPLADTDSALVIEDGSMEEGAKATIASLDDNRMIIWQMKDGYTIRSQVSQLVLDVEGASREPGTQIQQWEYNGDKSQIFTIANAGDGTYAILYDGDMALTYDGNGEVVIDYYQKNDSQKWTIQEE